MKLLKHQAEFLKRAPDQEAMFWDTGTGKTIAILSLLKSLGCPKTLVVCPLSIIKSVWGKHCEQMGIPWVNLREAGEINGVNLVNYEKFRREAETLIEERPELLVLDESSKIKNFRAQTTRAALKLSRRVPRRYVLTGTPAPNSWLEIWPQIETIKPGLLGGYYQYRQTYFYQTGYMGYEWKIKPGAKEYIIDKIKPFCSVVKKDKVLDLPPILFETRKIKMLPEQKKAYYKLLKEMVLEYKGISIRPHILPRIMTLRQLTSGFYYCDGAAAAEIGTAKWQELAEVLQEIGQHQVVIWCQFRWEAEKLSEILGESSKILYGKLPEKKRDIVISDFQEGKLQYLIAHPRVGGYGLDFQNVAYEIFLSLSYSFEEEHQSISRLHRYGQKRKVSCIYLLCENSIDEVIYEVLRRKGDMAKEIEVMLRRWK